MTQIGFKRLKIGVHDKVTGEIAEIAVVEGKTGEGGTVSAEISGLSSEPVKVYASNVAYYVVQKGTGDVSVDFGILDLPEKLNDAILGYKVDDLNGWSMIGDDTEPPFCSIILESENLKGEAVMLGIFKGKFSREAISLETKEEGNVEPEADSYTFSPVASDREDDTKGQTVAKYIGSEKATEFGDLVIPVTPVLP